MKGFLILILVICGVGYCGVHIDNTQEFSVLAPSNDEVYMDSIFTGTVDVYENDDGVSQVDLHGTEIYTVQTAQESTVNYYSGWSQDISAYDSGTINLYQVEAMFLNVNNHGTMNIYHGDYQRLVAGRFGTVNIYGYDFSYELPDPDVDGSKGWVAGFWEDATPFEIQIINFDSDGPVENPVTFDHIVFHEVPEPCSVLLFGFGGLLLRRR